MTNDSYSRYFSENDFFSKIKKLSGKLLGSALLLYMVLSEEKTPLYVKVAILGALGYFVTPFDAIPDFLPFGYTDDLAVLTALLASLDRFITAEMRMKAKEKLS